MQYVGRYPERIKERRSGLGAETLVQKVRVRHLERGVLSTRRSDLYLVSVKRRSQIMEPNAGEKRMMIIQGNERPELFSADHPQGAVCIASGELSRYPAFNESLVN